MEAATPTLTASAVDMTASGRLTGAPEAVEPVRRSAKAVTSTSSTSGLMGARCGPSSASSALVMSWASKARSVRGRTVSKLKRRFSAEDISWTPRSRRFAVAMTLKPCDAETRKPSPSSGTMSCFSDSTDTRVSWISGGQRVISSKRTRRPDSMAW